MLQLPQYFSQLTTFVQKTGHYRTCPFELDNFLSSPLFLFLSLHLGHCAFHPQSDQILHMAVGASVLQIIPRGPLPSTRLPGFWPSVVYSYVRKVRGVTSRPHLNTMLTPTLRDLLTLCNAASVPCLCEYTALIFVLVFAVMAVQPVYRSFSSEVAQHIQFSS